MNEAKYLSESPKEYRKLYGQYFTPPIVARIMVNWVMKDGAKSIMDPAFGLGVFYDSLKDLNLLFNLQFTGYEIDGKILKYYDEQDNLTVYNEDYLNVDAGLFDGIVCNPPYMRFQKFLNRHSVLPKIEEKIGIKIGGYSNIASVFLLKAISELKENGNLSFIMPFEFFNTGYGVEVKKILQKEGLLKEIIIFENEKDIFPNATTTVCVLLCKKDKQKDNIKISFVRSEDEILNINKLEKTNYRIIHSDQLPYNQKWSPIIFSLFSKQKIPEGLSKIYNYGSFIRGIATGANNFFALTKADIQKYQLPEVNIRKCLTKSQTIKTLVVTEDYLKSLSNNNEPVYCLDVKAHSDPSTINYIKFGETKGFHNRYLTKNRKPWYKIENRNPAPILFGVFNRGRLKVIRNYSNAINFTCFHGFYPNLFLNEKELDKLFVYLLSDLGQSIIKLNKREYGKNLDKLEPGDLNQCLCPNKEQLIQIQDKESDEVLSLVKAKNDRLAIEKSNEIIKKYLR